MKYTRVIGAPFTKLSLFSHKVSIIIDTIFLPFLETLNAGRIKLCPSVGSSSTPCFTLSLTKRHPRSASFGSKKNGSRIVLNLYCGEDEGEQSIPLLQLPPLCADCCAVWHCHERGGLYASCCLDKPFEFVV